MTLPYDSFGGTTEPSVDSWLSGSNNDGARVKYTRRENTKVPTKNMMRFPEWQTSDRQKQKPSGESKTKNTVTAVASDDVKCTGRGVLSKTCRRAAAAAATADGGGRR